MPDYLVFGSCLRSELPFPELAELRGRAPRWTLTLGSLDADDSAETLSDAKLSGDCRIHISRAKDRLRFSHSCAGTFELRGQGSEIVFDADRAVSIDAARTDLVSRLLLMSTDQDSVAWLHGSAARIGQSAVAFIGSSGAGKSTLALALAQAGAEHICDDALPIEPGHPPVVWASDGTVRLCSDTKRQFAPHANSVRRESDGKFVVARSALRPEETASNADVQLDSILDRHTDFRTPLSALYLLAPVPATASTGVAQAAVGRRLLAPSAAIALLIQHLKLGALVAPDYPASKMKQLGEIVRTVPVFELRIPRDWSLMADVVSQLVAWHNPGPVEQMANETAGIEK